MKAILQRWAGWIAARYEHQFIYRRRLQDGDIGIVSILHEQMHQVERLRKDLPL